MPSRCASVVGCLCVLVACCGCLAPAERQHPVQSVWVLWRVCMCVVLSVMCTAGVQLWRATVVSASTGPALAAMVWRCSAAAGGRLPQQQLDALCKQYILHHASRATALSPPSLLQCAMRKDTAQFSGQEKDDLLQTLTSTAPFKTLLEKYDPNAWRVSTTNTGYCWPQQLVATPSVPKSCWAQTTGTTVDVSAVTHKLLERAQDWRPWQPLVWTQLATPAWLRTASLLT